MKKIIGLALCTLFAVDVVSAAKLPEDLSYTIYVKGSPAGKAEIKVSYEGDTITFESTTSVDYGAFKMNARCRTAADAKTGIMRSFRWDGEKNGQKYSGELAYDGKVAKGIVRVDDSVVEEAKSPPAHPVIAFEDYIVEHEILLAHVHAAAGETGLTGSLLLPSAFSFVSVGMRAASEQIIESNIKEAVCRKLLVEMQGGSPWAIYFDDQRGLPVYLAFPSVGTEIFLDEFFGDEPVSRYTE